MSYDKIVEELDTSEATIFKAGKYNTQTETITYLGEKDHTTCNCRIFFNSESFSDLSSSMS